MEAINKSRVYLVHFIKKMKYLDFCIPELEALAEIQGVKPNNLYLGNVPRSGEEIQKTPYVYVNLPNEQAVQQI